MKFRAVPFILAAVVLSSGALAQTPATGTSPYTQSRTHAYTSFDNPYAPGGVYDPYRRTRPRKQPDLNSELPDAGAIDMDADINPCPKNRLTVGSRIADFSTAKHSGNPGIDNKAWSIAHLNRLTPNGYPANTCRRSTGIGSDYSNRVRAADRGLPPNLQK